MIGNPHPQSLIACRQRLIAAEFNYEIASLRHRTATTQLEAARAELNAASEACAEWLRKLQAASAQAASELTGISERRSQETQNGPQT